MTRREYLQKLWNGTPLLIEVEIRFVPARGWKVVPMEARYFDDTGDYIGRDWREAERYIRKLAPRFVPDEGIDGLRVCRICGDRETTSASGVCHVCREQQMIDEN